MSDRNRSLNLADALRTLPLAAPERSVWPEIATQLQRTHASARSRAGERFRRFVVPAVLAAALALVFVATRTPPGTPASRAQAATATVAPHAASSAMNSATADTSPLTALQKRSRDLERWLRETGDVAAPLQGQDLAAAAEIENLIGLVDVELAASRQAQDAGLWQRRVDLLEDLSALRYSNYQFAGGRTLAASSIN